MYYSAISDENNTWLSAKICINGKNGHTLSQLMEQTKAAHVFMITLVYSITVESSNTAVHANST